MEEASGPATLYAAAKPMKGKLTVINGEHGPRVAKLTVKRGGKVEAPCKACGKRPAKCTCRHHKSEGYARPIVPVQRLKFGNAPMVKARNLTSIGQLATQLHKGPVPFIGPRGGKWEDPQHKIPWKDSKSAKQFRSAALRKMPVTLQRLQALVDAGKVEGTVEQHRKDAKAKVARHRKDFSKFAASVRKAAPAHAEVMGRVKTMESTIGRVVRQPEWFPSTKTLYDVTGTRVVCRSIEEVHSTIAKLKAEHKVVKENDYISKPYGTYRSYHLIVEHNGEQKEIQVRTDRQNTMADWSHDIYKPMTPEQEAALEAHGERIATYAQQLDAFVFAADSGKSPPPPKRPACPDIVGQAFGCPKL